MILFLLLFAFIINTEDINLKETAYKSYLEGNIKKARELYLKIYEQERDIKSILDLAAICKYMDDYSEAIKYLEIALNIKQDTDIYSELGWLYFHLSKIEKAKCYFEKAFSIDRTNYSAALGISMVYSQIGDIIKTIEYLNIYKSIRGDYAGVDYLFAWNYVNFKMYDKAKEHLIKALKKDQSFVEARLPLAQLYLKEEDYNNAWNQYYRILDYIPDHPLAVKMIKAIEGKLTKQPEEIRPPFKIKNPTIISEEYDVNKFKKSMKLRVAIGTDIKGNHRKNKQIKISSFYNLSIYGKESGKFYRHLYKGEKWIIRYENEKINVYDNNLKLLNSFAKPFIIKSNNERDGSIIIEADKKSSNPSFKYSDREYRGAIEIVPLPGGFGIVNIIELELYLLGVVSSEMEALWPVEALKAQAVIARTEALRRMKECPHKKQGYHLCDTEHCQVYGGVIKEHKNSNKAVFDTEGEVLTYKNKLAYAFYHANCGGYIQASSEVKGWGKVSYLVSHPDGNLKIEGLTPWEFNLWIKKNPEAYCNYPEAVRDRDFRWIRIIKRADINFKLNKTYNIGEIKNIMVLKRSKSGHVNSIKIEGTKKTIILDKEHIIRSMFGLVPLKSTLFNIEINRFEDGKIRNIWFYGGGWGHAIGLCQSGASGMAGKEGKNYKEILQFYYPGTSIKKVKYRRK